MANDISNVSAGFSRAGHFNIDNVTDERIRNGNLTIGEARTIQQRCRIAYMGYFSVSTENEAKGTTENGIKRQSSLRKKWQDMHYPCQQDLSVIG